MRTLTILVALLFPILAQAHGDPDKKLPYGFYGTWESDNETRASAFYIADDNENFHRLLNGDIQKGDEPLYKVHYVNPNDKNESIDIIVIGIDRLEVKNGKLVFSQLRLMQYYYHDGITLTTYLYCLNTELDSYWHLVSPRAFPYGEGKSRRSNIESLGWYLYTEHFMRYIVYTAYPSKAP